MSSSNREGSTGYFLRNSMDSVKGLQNSDSITTGRTPHKPLLPVHTVGLFKCIVSDLFFYNNQKSATSVFVILPLQF